jgi:subtilase family serine protease
MLAAVAVGALVTGGMFATAAPSVAATPAASSHSTQVKGDGTAAVGPSAGKNVQHLCATAKKGEASCLALARTDIEHHLSLSPNATPDGYGPSDLQDAYALPSGGSGQTVGIVDAYDDPNAESDLAQYRSQYGLPSCTTSNGCFKKVGEDGTSSLPSADSGWAGEISLDLDMVSAVCPSCNILLVEADQPTMEDLGASVNTAVDLGAKYVSNSYGGSESSEDTSYDSSYFNHPGVAITVSSGDEGYGAEYPAASKYVTSVGGTSLNTSSNSRGWTETVWGDSSSGEGTGSGCSSYDAKPSWQTDTGCSKRTIADVSAVADPYTGLAVYDSYDASGWQVYGGTSASSPIIASVYALAGAPGASDSPASYPYSHTGDLNDVTSGTNGSCSGSYLCTAGTGYDGPTGLGTPNGTAAFTSGGGGGGGTGNTVSVTNPGTQSTVVNTSVSLTVKASDSDSGESLTYSASGLPAGLSINSSTGVISGTPTTVGNSSVTVTAKDSTGASGSASFTWKITSTSGGGCDATQVIANPGFESGSADWTATSGVIDDSSDAPAHSGSYKAWFDGYGESHTDTLSQSVTIPSDCTSATLTYYLYVSTEESGSTAYDTFKVTAGGSTVASYSNVDDNGGYEKETVDLSSYAGQTFTLKFTGTEDYSLATSFLLDDTALNVS